MDQKAPRQHTAYISLGSNMGNRLQACRNAITALAADGGGTICGRSRFYQTSPVGDTDQDWYLNCAVALTTPLQPAELLALCLNIEKRAGRVRTQRRYGPRVLDLDIVIFGTRVIKSPELTIPHPRMHERRFVLQPICDINPQLQHPLLNKSIGELLETLQDPSQQIKVYPCDY